MSEKNRKYQPYLEDFGENWTSFHLSASLSQEERNRDYDLALDEVASQLSSEHVSIQRQQYLDAPVSEEILLDEDLPLISRFSAKHPREVKRKASSRAMARKIALGLPVISADVICSLGVKNAVFCKLFEAKRLVYDSKRAKHALTTLSSSDWHLYTEKQRAEFKAFFKSYVLNRNELERCLKTIRSTKKLCKVSYHYSAFSIRKKRFFK